MAEPVLLNPNQLRDLKAWVDEPHPEIPLAIMKSLAALVALYQLLADTQSKYTIIVRRLREAMGFERKSEKLSSDQLKDSSGVKGLEAKINQAKKALQKKKDQLRLYRDRLKEAKAARKSQRQARAEAGKPAATRRKNLIDQPKDKALSVGTAAKVNSTASRKVDRSQFDFPKGLHSTKDKNKRFIAKVELEEVTYEIETVTCPKTGKTVRASMDDVGPKNCQVTWETIANVIMLAVVHSIPVNRIAKIFSCYGEEALNSTSLINYIQMAGKALEKLYIHLGESLADLPRIMGDDTNTRVLAMEKAASQGNHDSSDMTQGIIGRLAELFGRTNSKKKGKGLKRKINISAVCGKTDINDPRSYVFFFRTHFGSVGDLLTKLLEQRRPSAPRLTILGDLSSTNLPAKIASWLNFKVAGCSAHARRPFWRYRNQDPQLCYFMARCFQTLAAIEQRLDDKEADWDMVLAHRRKYSLKVYKAMRNAALRVLAGKPGYDGGHVWPKGTKLYDACYYLVKNYEALTRFVNDPHLPLTNNTMERVLRPEKLHTAAAKFIKSEEGRVTMDILRSITTTATAAQVDVKAYLIWVLQNSSALEADPSKFTPFEYAKKQDRARA